MLSPRINVTGKDQGPGFNLHAVILSRLFQQCRDICPADGESIGATHRLNPSVKFSFSQGPRGMSGQLCTPIRVSLV